ncbi:AAA-like domain-containing protein [Candidatus Albibeggiatoa sp. nov. BB20]|uniref:AAA-like domain-containing protein n=1 Tax=Candidatus Albibeggiatoa sp. nov. BB20 TaxID=3162723 RepID=UPI00336563BB
MSFSNWVSLISAILGIPAAILAIFAAFGMTPKVLYRKIKAKFKPAPPDNPFRKKGRLDNPQAFYKRESLLREIYGELKKGSSVVLLADEQMGKSSILYHIFQLGKQEQSALSQHQFVYLDLNQIHDGKDFFSALCDELQLPVDKIPNCRGYDLHKYLQGKKYVLCLDEIERLTCDKFDREMRDELRGLAEGESTPFTLLIASHKPLNEVFADLAHYQSPLANICHTINIKPLRLDEVVGLIEQYLQGQRIQFSEEEIAGIFEQSQGHPYQVQQLASDLYVKKQGSYSGVQI